MTKPRHRGLALAVSLAVPLFSLLFPGLGCSRSGATKPNVSLDAPSFSPEAVAAAVRSLPDLLPPGHYVAEHLDVRMTPRLLEIGDKMQAAFLRDPEWVKNYTRTHAAKHPGVPLPYHARLGLTEEEHAEYVALAKTRILVPVATFLFAVERSGPVVRFRTGEDDERSRCLNDLEIDTATGRLTTPVAVIDLPTPMPGDPTTRNLGPWHGVYWLDEVRDRRETTGHAVRLTVGRTPETGYFVFGYRALVKEAGVVVRQDTVLFRFRATP